MGRNSYMYLSQVKDPHQNYTKILAVVKTRVLKCNRDVFRML